MALNVIAVANSYLDRMSPVASSTPTELRGELATMEREVSLAGTQKNLSHTPTAKLESTSAAAKLAVELIITQEWQDFRLMFHGRKGGDAVVGCSRPEL